MKRTFSLTAGLLAVFLLVGCGGGGGGSSESPYTGITSQAPLDNNNVVDVAREAYQAGDLTASAVVPLGVSGTESSGPGSPRALALVRLLRGVVERVEVPAASPSQPSSVTGAVPMEVVTVSETITDGFGGSASISLTLDTVTGDFTGTFAFTGWHGEGGGLISGPTSVTGHYVQSTGEFTQIRFTFHSVTMVDGADSVTITGTVELSVGVSSGSATIEMYLEDNGTRKTVWIHEYTVIMTEGPDASPADGIPDYTDADISGRIYLHDYGCVDVSTPTSFRFYDGYTHPSTGILLVEGSEGRKARLVVIDGIPESSGYIVEADLEPDGIYEWISIDHPWI